MKHLPNLKQVLTNVKEVNLDNDQKKSLALALLLLFTVVYPLIAPSLANAAGPFVATKGYIRPDLHDAGTATPITVCMQPQTSGSNATSFAITFPTGFGVSATTANWNTTSGTGTITPAGSTAFPGINGTTAAVSAQTVTWTFTAQTLSSANLYCFYVAAAALTNHATPAGNYTGSMILTDATAGNETTSFALSTVTANTDKLTVTGSVGATFTLSQTTAGSQALGPIGTSGATSGTVSVYTVATNAHNGWQAWIKSTTGTLHSAGAATDIPLTNSPAYATGAGNVQSLSGTGASNYVIDSRPTSGSSAATEFAGNGTDSGGRPDLKFQPFSSDSSAATNDQFGVIARARVSATQAAATDYTDTLTIVAAGQF